MRSLARLGILGLTCALPVAAAAAPRPPWTSSRVVGTPDPPLPYKVEDAFPRLRFERPVELVTAPGSDRLYLLELGGKIWSFANRADAADKELFCNLQPIKGIRA